jgi:Tol biopolymer transport system component
MDIFVADLAGGGSSRLTFDAATEDYPIWSPDNAWVAFNSARDGRSGLYRKRSNGLGPDEKLLESGVDVQPSDWSRTNVLVYTRTQSPSDDVVLLPLDGDRQPRPFLDTPANESQGHVSPNGAWIAYVSDGTSQSEVYVRSFPDGANVYQISAAGGLEPRWRADGQELFFMDLGRRVMAVAIPGGDVVRRGQPQALFEGLVESARLTNRWAVSKDGQRFIVNVPASSVSTSPLTVVMAWHAAGGR